MRFGLEDDLKQEPAFFADHDVVLVYIAKKLKEALEVEDLFTQKGLDYCVEADEYHGGFLFRTTRTGAFFYVAKEDEGVAVALLEGASKKPLPADLRTTQ